MGRHTWHFLLSTTLRDGLGHGRAFIRPAAWQSSSPSFTTVSISGRFTGNFFFFKVSSLLWKKTALFLAMTSLCFLMDLSLQNTFLLFRFLAVQKGIALTMRFCNKDYFFFAGIPNCQICKEKQAPYFGLFFLLHLILLSDASGELCIPQKGRIKPICFTLGNSRVSSLAGDGEGWGQSV